MGGKQTKRVNGSVVKEYLPSGVEYDGDKIEAIYHAEGRAIPMYNPVITDLIDSFRYEYVLRDHLGNGRVYFSDKDEDSFVDVGGVDSEIMQENHYYPFGLNHEGPFYATQPVANQYQYNGKELNEEFGLNWNDYGARFYDPAIGRFPSVDALADDPFQIDKSPYAYAWNNPVKLTGPDGNCPKCFKVLLKTVGKSIAKGKLDLSEVYDVVDNGITLLSSSSSYLERGEALFNLASPISTKEIKGAKNFIAGAGDAAKGGKKIVYTATDGPVDLNRLPSKNSSGGIGGTFVTETDITDQDALIRHMDIVPPNPFGRDVYPNTVSEIEVPLSGLKPDPTDTRVGKEIGWIPPKTKDAKVTRTFDVSTGEDMRSIIQENK